MPQVHVCRADTVLVPNSNSIKTEDFCVQIYNLESIDLIFHDVELSGKDGMCVVRDYTFEIKFKIGSFFCLEVIIRYQVVLKKN